MLINYSITQLLFFWLALANIGSFYTCPQSPMLLSRSSSVTSSVRLGTQPSCGNIDSSQFGNMNTGLCLSDVKTIYTFGDSYTDNGSHHGGAASPAVPQGISPFYGGRASNGPMYSEYLASSGVAVKNYAIGGATVDRELWLRRRNSSDMVSHISTFLEQQNVIEPDSTVAIIFYGINDMGSLAQGPGTMKEAAERWLELVKPLIESGFTQFIVISVPDDAPTSREYGNTIWQGLKELRYLFGINFSYIDLMELWRNLFHKIGEFGLKYITPCLNTSLTTVGGCSDPQDHLFWTPGHPQTLTHLIISEWIRAVLNTCTLS